MKYFIQMLCGLVILGFLGFPTYVWAETESYVVDLFYDAETDTLRLDKFISEPVNTSDQDINLERYNLYLDEANLEIAEDSADVPKFTINYQGADSGYTWTNYLVGEIPDSGPFTLSLPFYEHAVSFTIIHPNGGEVEVSVEEYNLCNQNFVCEFEQGENQNTCITDCTGDTITFSEGTLQTLQEQNGVIRDEEGTILLSTQESADAGESEPTTESEESTEGPSWITLVGGLLMMIGAIGFLVYKKVKK